MKNLLAPLAVILLLSSCGNKTTDTTVTTDSTKVAATPELALPVKYKNWEIGNPEYVKDAVDLYKAWDDKDTKIASYFADTFVMRIPEETNKIIIPNDAIDSTLKGNRNMYDLTSNDLISAVSLHDKESGEDWVMVTTYNKWINKDGSRDSILYQDNWRFKNGKINLLTSFDKVPSK
jgi:hypothetical protein